MGSLPGGLVLRVLPAVWIAAACRGADRVEDVQRRDSAGIAIVGNLAEDRPLRWTLEEVLRLGGTDEGPEAFSRVEEDGVAADGEGRLYVLDVRDPRVEVFDTDGTHLRTLGREGQGPGEMAGPRSLFVSAAGAAGVLALGKRGFVRFDAHGAVMDELRLPTVTGAARERSALLPGGAVVMAVGTVMTRSGELRTGAPLRTRVMLFEPEGEGWGDPVELAAIEWEQPAFSPVGAESCPMKIATPPVFSREPVWRVAGDRVLSNGVDEYRFEITSLDGGARTSVRRTRPVVEATRALAAAEIGPASVEIRGVSCEQTAEERAGQAGWQDRIPWIEDLQAAPDGRILVLRRAPGEDPKDRIDVFEPDGAYLGTLPPGFPFPAAWRGPDEILRIERDELDRPYVVVYRVVRR